jgi:SagB-type dehydrogenase family enzyme
MRLRRALPLVISWSGTSFQVTNYLRQKSFECDLETLRLLSSANTWQTPEWYFEQYAAFDADSVANQLGRLVELGALVAEGTADARVEATYDSSWRWGHTAGLYHFGIKNSRFIDANEAGEAIRQYAATSPSPPLFSENAGCSHVIELPVVPESAVMTSMARRRTCRDFAPQPIDSEQLAAILFAGCGITGLFRDPVLGEQPVKMTPSGGARNPFEAYVYVARVKGVPSGVYHYAGMSHSLGLIAAAPLPPASKLVADQLWFDDAAAVVFLAADFERTAWKYRHPNAYRVVLIEAGHIGQNMAVIAASMSIGSAPTCAIRDSLMEEILNLDPCRQAVPYAYAFGHLKPSAA